MSSQPTMTEELIHGFDADCFCDFLRSKFPSFSMARRDIRLKQADFPWNHAEHLGVVKTLAGPHNTNLPLLVVCARLPAGEPLKERASRVKQFKFARQTLDQAMSNPSPDIEGVLTQGLFVFFDDDGNFRLSLVFGSAEGTKLVWSSAKRLSFYVETDAGNKTFRDRMALPWATFDKLKEAFSVEKLTREFYGRLFTWYQNAMKSDDVVFPNDIVKDKKPGEVKSEQIIRLITRLMFVWFIKQKNLVPDDLFDPAKLKTVLKNFTPGSGDNYYRAILQNLFFATLNSEIGERAFAVDAGKRSVNVEHFDIKTLYRYGSDFAVPEKDVLALFRPIPFLNGGLFECLDRGAAYFDGFSRNQKKLARVPNRLFFDEQLGLIPLLNQYNFTVEENSPGDEDVALDPELLGKVFENLLGAYNPETEVAARKSTGSFYTPREIVNYMVDESLIAHLKSRVPEIEESVLREIVGTDPPPELNKELRRKLVEAVFHCRVLDPACGSGAFPMGMLLKMVHVLQRLDPKNSLWNETVLAQTEAELKAAETLSVAEKREYLRRVSDHFDQSVNEPDYTRKLYLIEYCLFGVDIQPIAVQIAKLRAFITLVCDQQPDLTNVAGNYGMLPLPNLETKFVAADSLIGLPHEGDHLDLSTGNIADAKDKLWDVRHRHFQARRYQDKKKLRKQDHDLRAEIKATVKQEFRPNRKKLDLLLKERERISRSQEMEVQPHTVQEAFEGYAPEKSKPRVSETDANGKKLRELDADIERERKKADTPTTVIDKIADMLASWDPYDQNASSPFFDPEWMFNVKGGFDVVIGNPPYGFRNVLSSEQKAYFRKVEGISFPTGDVAELFIIKSLSGRVAPHGTLTFVIPKKSLYGESWANVRKLWLTHSLLALMDASQAFENVLLEQMAFIIRKSEPTGRHVAVGRLEYDGSRIDVFGSFPVADIFSADKLNAQIYRGLYSQDMLNKLKKASVDSTSDFIKAEIGVSNITKHLTLSKKGNYPCLKGIDLVRYGIKPTLRYLDGNVAKPYIREYSHAKIVAQEIIAHIQNPVPHISIALFYDQDNRLFNDTCVEIRVVAEIVDPLFLLGYLQSRFVAWYAYNIVYNRAIRTMHFINYYVQQMPIPKKAVNDVSQQRSVAEISRRILAAKKADPATDVSDLEAEIDRLVYQLYNLTPEEIAIVEQSVDRSTKPAASAKAEADIAPPAKAQTPKKRKPTLPPSLPGWD